MGRLGGRKIDYEGLRNARILENQARLASLGLQKTISDLRTLASPAKSGRTHVKRHCKKVHFPATLRRSGRLNRGTSTESSAPASVRRSLRFEGNSTLGKTEGIVSVRRSNRHKCIKGASANSPASGGSIGKEDEEITRAANKPLLDIEGSDYQLSPEASARRCNSKGRGSVYDPIFGICCHFCRQKKLCGEEDCKRCSDLDVNQQCMGKTDCSVCHSSTGVLCRACLKVRYGEEMEEAKQNKEWMCPHCVEAKGVKPFWICNSSLCLRKRDIVPTGIAIFRAREMGYESVAHFLMEELQRASEGRT